MRKAVHSLTNVSKFFVSKYFVFYWFGTLRKTENRLQRRININSSNHEHTKKKCENIFQMLRGFIVLNPLIIIRNSKTVCYFCFVSAFAHFMCTKCYSNRIDTKTTATTVLYYTWNTNARPKLN